METNTPQTHGAKRPFIGSPMFFAGCGMWTLVIGAAVWILFFQNERTDDDSVNGAKSTSIDAQIANNGPSEDPAQQQSLVIVTKSDGTQEVVEKSKIPTETVWDPNGVADFEFTDQEGRKVAKADLLGKPWAICFVFTHCAATCPRVTESMRELQDRLKDCDFRLVTLTVDPERDTPEVLKGYGETRGADFSKWMFLGGDKTATYRLIQGSFQMPVQETLGKDRKPGFEFIHSNNIMLVDEKGVVRGKFDATKGESMSNLRREIRKLVKGKEAETEKEPDSTPVEKATTETKPGENNE